MAIAALLAWPLIALGLFAALRPVQALIISVVAGYLLLPEVVGINLPVLPTYNKYLAISTGALLGASVFARTLIRVGVQQKTPNVVNAAPIMGWVLLISAALLVIGPFLTWRANLYPLFYGPVVLPGLSLYDTLSAVQNNFIVFLPFLLGWLFLRDPESHQTLLVVLFTAGALYAFLAAIEIRLSPQLNNWVYGFFPHSWIQHVRGGFRPLVFLQHGLWLGFFLLTAVLAGLALLRQHLRGRVEIWFVMAWLFLILAISKNLGALMLVTVFGSALLLLSISWQGRLAAVVVAVFLSYPVVFQARILPVDWFLTQVSGISEDRAQSFEFRLRNEEQLLAWAAEKPLTGWGGYGRNRIFNDQGRDLSITDGRWIQKIGAEGWVGYFGFFLPFCAPVVLLLRTRRRKEVPIETTTLGLIVAANCVYLIPNSTLTPVGWLIAGALAGFVQFDRKTEDTTEAEPLLTKPVYARFPGPAMARRPRLVPIGVRPFERSR